MSAHIGGNSLVDEFLQRLRLLLFRDGAYDGVTHDIAVAVNHIGGGIGEDILHKLTGIAAGAKAVLATFVEELAARRIRGIVTQTGCAGHCKDEPTVEITLPGRRPVLYGHVTAERVAELVERQIVRGETAEGLIEA